MAMTDAHDRVDSLVSQMSRRRALAGAGALVTAGGSVALVGRPARAEVDMETFTVSDAEFERESLDPVLDVTATYDYDVGDEAVNALEFRLLADGDEIAFEDLQTDRVTLANDTELSGRILESEAWSAADFEPSIGEEVSRQVEITLEFAVVTSEGTVLADDSATDTAEITVVNPQQEVIVAKIGGSGQIRASDD